MHSLPHEEQLFRYRVAAALLLLKWLIIPAAMAFLGYWLVVALVDGPQDQAHDRNQVHLALGMMGVALGLLIVQWVLAAKCRCPLCLGTPLARKACVKHRTALRLFGSYRLRVAHSIMWTGCFRCPFCGETTVMQVRQRRQRGHRR